ncbi:MAG: macro domain-containing protein [Anaerolineae bacterium]|nr:macro domain-containing protein [Anaerolineae bacterium]
MTRSITVNDVSIELQQGDITDLAVAAIVNAANSALVLGSGVAGAIAHKGGPTIQAECDKIGGCPVGSAAITGGGNLPAAYVIHAVGPRMGEGDEERKLAGATRSSLDLAARHNLSEIAFPAISTGVFGYPLTDCARIILTTAINFATGSSTSVRRIIFCLWDNAAYRIFDTTLNALTSA